MTPISGLSGHYKPMRQSKALACFHVFPLMIWMLFAGGLSVQAALENEWTFESDPNGQSLTNAYNSSGTAQFTGRSIDVFTASATNFQSSASNRVLLCVGSVPSTGGSVWTNGAVLDAALTSVTSGVQYLRYDVAYNLSTSTSVENSGMMLGTYFTGASGSAVDKSVGLVLGYDIGNTLKDAVPANRHMTAVTTGLQWTNGLPWSGTLTAIAEVNITNIGAATATLKVWYGLNGSTPTDYSKPAFITNYLLSAITNLRFRATGDFRPTIGSTNYAAVDNIRMADNWADIIAKVPDFSKGPAAGIDSIIITTPKGTFTNSGKAVNTAIGATNTVKIVVRSLGSPASNITSSVTASVHPEYFSITSNSTPGAPLPYPQLVTNTFSVIIGTNAQDDVTYVFNASATAGGASGVSTANFSLAVGATVVYTTNSITVISTNGVIPSKYEPGEILEIKVTSVNIGTRPVTNVVNSLSADPAYFTITNLTSTNYPVVAVDAVTSTTYRVEIATNTPHGTYRFSVTNQSYSLVWPDFFPVDVFKQGIPLVSPASITINLLAGSIANNTQVLVTNAGDAALTFAITDDSPWGTFYKVTTGTRGISDFVTAWNFSKVVLKDPADSDPFTSSTNAGVSSAASIGFNFPFYGIVYSNFYVTADGYIGLSNTTNSPGVSMNRAGDLSAVTPAQPPLIAPFWGRLISPAGSIKTILSKNNYRVISYSGVSQESGGTNLQFQVALFTNGCIEFRYKNIVGITNSFGTTNVTIGVQGSRASYVNLALKPVNGTSVRLTPQRNQWVSYATQDVGLDQQSAAGVTFTADASGITATTSLTFNAWFNWSAVGSNTFSLGSNAVAVTVNVTALAPVYSAVANLSFTGTAAQVTSVPFIINNLGSSPLTFTITDTNTAIAGYTNDNSWRVTSVISTNSAGVISTNSIVSTNSLVYNWIDISSTGTKVSLIDPDPANPYITAANDGFSAMIPLKFTFPFYGGFYTQFCASVNGALRLDTSGEIKAGVDLAAITNVPPQMIAPYWGDLMMDANATLKYRSTADQMVITWENVQQYRLGGGSNLTFQAILKPSGDITFQYKKLEGLQWPGTTIGLRHEFMNTTTNTTHPPGTMQADIRQPGDWTLTTNLYGMVSTQYVNAVSNRAVRFQSAQVKVIGYTPGSGSIPARSNAVITITGDASSQSVGTNNISTNTILTIVHNVAAGSTNTANATLAVTFTTTNSLEVVFLRSAMGGDGAGLAAEGGLVTLPVDASVFSPKVEGAPGAISLSWTAPQDGVQRIYTIYSTTDLMSGWDYLAAVTNATTYLDTRIIDVPTIYYKIIVTVE